MLDKHVLKKILLVVPLLILAVLIQSPQANASRGGHHEEKSHYRSYGHGYPYGRSIKALPREYVSVSFGGVRFYYSSGVFYKHHHYREYVVVEPPRGAIVRIVSPDCDQVIIRGATYYTSNGVYYRRISRGYQVVEPPSVVIIEEPVTEREVVMTKPTRNNDQDSFTVNISNNRGGYTAVVLKRSGGGFIGPQGEFYPDFPKVEQLKLMYAK